MLFIKKKEVGLLPFRHAFTSSAVASQFMSQEPANPKSNLPINPESCCNAAACLPALLRT
jgi:hypothetical protein